MHNVIINHMTEYMMKQEKETVTTVVVIFLPFYRIQFNWINPRVFINQIATTKKELTFVSIRCPWHYGRSSFFNKSTPTRVCSNYLLLGQYN